jgi:hypothetical protein
MRDLKNESDMDIFESYLVRQDHRSHWLRVDTAEILKRFFYCERTLIIGQAGWLAALAPYPVKTTLPRLMWEMALTAHALRERVLELHYPSRLIEVGDDEPLVAVFDQAIHAPGAEAFLLGLAEVLVPALLAAYRGYAAGSDELADGPTLHFLRAAIADKVEQVSALTQFAEHMLVDAPGQRAMAEDWVSALKRALRDVGGVSLHKPGSPSAPLALPGRPFALAEVPARDEQFHLCRFYWPDIIDSTFPYGEGLRLQLRSAVSHFNEVWAVESGGAILHAFADVLPWEFIFEAARWTYDESRHTRMGHARLQAWGFEPNEIPLGSYIYDSARGAAPVVRLGMLHYFETKNIGNKIKRADAFASYHDRLSQHDMEFDWADETIHAHYGKRWYDALRAKDPDHIPPLDDTRENCDRLVAAEVASATSADRDDIRRVAEAMVAKAEQLGRLGE